MSKFVFAKSMPEIAFAFLFQTATPSPSPASAPEQLPAWLTLIYMTGLALVGLLLILSIIRNWLKRSGHALTAPAAVHKDVRKRLGATTTNRGLKVWRWLFALIARGPFWRSRLLAVCPEHKKSSRADYKAFATRVCLSNFACWITIARAPARFTKGQTANMPLLSDGRVPGHIFWVDRGDPVWNGRCLNRERGAARVWQNIRGETMARANKDVRSRRS